MLAHVARFNPDVVIQSYMTELIDGIQPDVSSMCKVIMDELRNSISQLSVH